MATKVIFSVQSYKAKGRSLIGEPSILCRSLQHALLRAEKLAPGRAGVLVIEQQVGDDEWDNGELVVHAVHGQVPDAWGEAKRAA